ncbi:hypothetical protein VMF7928_01053 [Vibrio marisflavi CECT 7928]|uniref:Uncharacterized protein n=1 Tax=Vibrio marisflavi CECT 7928 TaxID=634439 RepID=A0ABM9A1B3_9VIBR|nr:hypothetical protein VMF7928_01053 [Vibrio marisflavi CECT 7928]
MLTQNVETGDQKDAKQLYQSTRNKNLSGAANERIS